MGTTTSEKILALINAYKSNERLKDITMGITRYYNASVWINTSKTHKELQDIMISIKDELKQQRCYDLKDLYKYASLNRKFDKLQKAIGDIVNTKLGISDLTKQDILHIIYCMIMDQQPKHATLDFSPSNHFENFYTFLYPYQIEIHLHDSYYKNTQNLMRQQRDKYDYRVMRILVGQLNGEQVDTFITVYIKGFETENELMDFFISQIQDLKEIEDIKSSRSDDESSRLDLIRLHIYSHGWDLTQTNEKYDTSMINTNGKLLIKNCFIIGFPINNQCQECNDASRISIIPGNIFAPSPTYLLIPEPNLWYIFKKLNNNKEYLREFVENHIKASYKILTLFNPEQIHISLGSGWKLEKPTDSNIWILDTNKGIEIENTIMDTAVMQSIQSIYDRLNLNVDDFVKSKQNEQTQGLTV